MSKRSGNAIVLDLGTSSIKGIAVRSSPSGFEVLGYAQAQTRGMDITGIKDAVALKECIEAVLDEIKSQIGRFEYEELRVAFSDDTYAISRSSEELSLDSEEPVLIDESILNELLDRLGVEKGFEVNPTAVLHVFPIQYTLDGVRRVVNPLELEARKLAVDAYTATVSSVKGDSIRQILQGIVGELPIVFYSPGVAAGYATTTEAEREQGSFVIEIGHSFVTTTFFTNGVPVLLAVSPLGFRYVIKDVSRVFGTSIPEAERLVKNFGHADVNPPDADASIDYFGLDGRTRRTVKKRELSLVIYARLREILNRARKVAYESFSGSSVPLTEGPHSVILTGGGAKLPGTVDTSAEVFRGFVRTGNAESGSHIPVEGPDEVLRDPVYSVCIGTLTTESRRRMEKVPMKKKKKAGFIDFLRELFGW
ncbi:MAG: cell division protein FtsA [Thermotogota bacterium]|nr:cell division protein FtsA [Thermotogota bacterium]MDK2864634.1 cell division protein FtsA [Thermotogota bacterium]